MKPDTRTWLVRGTLLAAALIAALLAWQQLRPAAEFPAAIRMAGQLCELVLNKTFQLWRMQPIPLQHNTRLGQKK